TWKNKSTKLKRIIWAPHHRIDEKGSKYSFSNFLKFHQSFLELAQENSDKIQIAFKPHPLLKQKLYVHKDWGVEKTRQYYNSWAQLPNGQLALDDYIDLFLTSDAMILDSISFIAEYAFTRKPS